MPIASLAKENEEIFIPQKPEPIILPRSSPALQLLQRLRDEAHRFALGYHQRVRKRETFASVLDTIPGIGPKRKRALLRQFGSVSAIKEASVEELAAARGMTAELGQKNKGDFIIYPEKCDFSGTGGEMPANLPPQYHEAEENFRLAKTIPEKVAALEEMLAIMPKHKGTDHLRAKLRAKIAQLTEASEKKLATKRTSTVIPKEGAAQVAVIGLPNSGKSQLVATITNASPAVAEYPFTTHSATPGMMEFENIKIQLIDTPPLAPQSIDFWLPPLLRRADALLIMVDLG